MIVKFIVLKINKIDEKLCKMVWIFVDLNCEIYLF